MANLYLCPDDFWRCPIDLNHQVLAKRFQYHIRRCTIANPHIRRVRCVFNANHLTTPENLLQHMSTCPDAIERSTVLIGLSNELLCRPWSANQRRPSTPTDWRMFRDVTATEDWDDDIRERQARKSAISDQMIASPSIQSIVISSDHVQHRSGRNFALEPAFFEDDSQMETTTSYKPVPAFKQAHVLKEHEHDGRIHPVETDELTKNLMKIRTLQLIGGAGRGACCLLDTSPPAPGLPPRKSA